MSKFPATIDAYTDVDGLVAVCRSVAGQGVLVRTNRTFGIVTVCGIVGSPLMLYATKKSISANSIGEDTSGAAALCQSIADLMNLSIHWSE